MKCMTLRQNLGDSAFPETFLFSILCNQLSGCSQTWTELEPLPEEWHRQVKYWKRLLSHQSLSNPIHSYECVQSMRFRKAQMSNQMSIWIIWRTWSWFPSFVQQQAAAGTFMQLMMLKWYALSPPCHQSLQFFGNRKNSSPMFNK